MPRNPLKFSYGFSLIEVMVAVGVMSVVLFFMTSMITQQNQSLKNFKNQISMINLEKDVSILLSKTNSCTNALTFPISMSNIQTNTINDININDKYGNLLLTSNSLSPKNKYDNLLIDKVVLTNPNNLPAGSYGMAELLIFVKANNSTLSLSPVTVPLTVSLNATGKVISCTDAMGSWADVPSGVSCGMYMQTQGTVRANLPCLGYNPKNSCPSGFTRADLGYFEAGSGSRQFATCIKQ